MSKVEEKGRPKYSKFDKMETSVLEAILRADFDAPEAERLDVETIIYISNLLTERQKMSDTDVNKAKDDFFKYYYPLEKSIYDFGDEDDNNFEPETAEHKPESKTDKVVPFHTRLWRRFASAAAVFVLLMFGGTVTAYALGYNPLGVIGKWNDEHFWLERDIPTAELRKAVAIYSDEDYLVPKWLPDGYAALETTVSELDSFVHINADFYKENNDVIDEIFIDYIFLSNDYEQPLYEKDTQPVEKYKVHNISHYIIENLGKRTIVWRNDKIEGSIIGNFSQDEAKKIINSIYEE